VCNIFAYHKLYTPAERLVEIDGLCRSAGIGCVDCKKEIIERFFTRFAKIRKRRAELSGQPDYIDQLLTDGAHKAAAEAEQTMLLVREAMKMGIHP